MLGERLHVTVLVVIVLVSVLVASAGVQGQPTTDATNDLVTRQRGCIADIAPHQCQQNAPVLPPNRTGQTPQPPEPMRASVSQTGSNSFRVAVQNARYGESTAIDPPSSVGDSGFNTDLRGLTVASRGGTSRFNLDFTVDRNLTAVSSGSASSPPAAFDTPLLYSNMEASADSSAFGISYDFDVESDFLREYNARQDDIVVAVYRRGGWQTVGTTPGSQSGNETVVGASVDGPGLVAVGLQHPDIRVTGVEPQNQTVLSNRTSQLELTLRNNGSRDGTETFTLTADDRQLASPTVSVAAGSQRTVTVPVEFSNAGETDVEVGAYETQITVTEPTPDIEVTELSVDRTRVQTGDTVTVDAMVTNNGTAGGVGTVQFRAFGDTVTTKQVSVAPGQTRTVQFTQEFAAPGKFQIGVNNQTTTITVNRSPDWEATPANDAGTITSGDAESESDASFQWALILLGTGLVLLFGLATVGRMMRE